MRIAVVTDSNSGMSPAEAKALGIILLPMPFMINGETYLDGVNLTHEEFYRSLNDDLDVSTSQPSPDSVLSLWDELLCEYDQIVHIPMSSGLSSSYETAAMLARDETYEGRVFVVDNKRISVTQKQSAKDALLLASMGLDGAAIRKRLEETAADSVIYIMVDTLRFLKKGGRITPAAALLGTLLKIKPVLQILGDKLDAYAKARTPKLGKSIMLNAIEKDLETRLHDPECRDTYLCVVHSQDEAAAAEFKEEVARRFPAAGEIEIAPLSLSIACHIGPGSLAVTATRKMVEEHEKAEGTGEGDLS